MVFDPNSQQRRLRRLSSCGSSQPTSSPPCLFVKDQELEPTDQQAPETRQARICCGNSTALAGATAAWRLVT
jgi:hypothetical protein